MNIDLRNTSLFFQDEIVFDKNVNFVFGKNGCGKSTIVQLIREQLTTRYDVRIFQGFESVVGENRTLNTVILGEENEEINQQILKYEAEIVEKQKEIDKIKRDIDEPIDGDCNLYTELADKTTEVREKYEEIRKFFTDSARKIKNFNPQIAHTTYNQSHFKDELPHAKLLTSEEFNKLIEVVNSESKSAKRILEIDIDCSGLLQEVNKILETKVEEKTHLVRLGGDNQKRQFAEDGLKLHKAGDYCAFCNNLVTQKVVTELEKYFSADEVNTLREKISNKIAEISSFMKKLGLLNIHIEDFYPDLREQAEHLKCEIENAKLENDKFVRGIKNALEEKLGNLFQESTSLDINQPKDICQLIKQYNNLVKRNNDTELPQRKEAAKCKLRYHLIKQYCNGFNYDVQKNEFINKQESLKSIEQKVDNKKAEIEKLNIDISNINKNIKQTQDKTKNEKILVDRINKKLKLYVSFELVYQPEYKDYKVKCLRTNDIRDVVHLSTGEKNIIAFLYFIEKLEEYSEDIQINKKCIIFDDPMNSNDDSVQYLIIEELQKLAKKVSDNNRMVILTHNSHFYINIKHRFKYRNSRFYKLFKIGKGISDFINISSPDQDIKTSYDALWNDLNTIYNHQKIEADMLLNPIRRIFETYTKFNNIKKEDFLGKVDGAKKLFDVNSHSIDDLEADLNGMSKQEIIDLMKECFIQNNSEAHFIEHFRIN